MGFEAINAIQNRMNQIESMVNGKISSVSAAAANQGQTPLNFDEVLNLKIGEMSPSSNMAALPQQNMGAAASPAHIKPLAQNNGISCGQTSVAMCVNALTGKNLIDGDINAKYGFGLLEALNAESKTAGVDWKDGGEVGPGSWALLEQKVNVEGLPAIVGLNGPEFSPSGRGHIVTITKIEGDTVHYADPADGSMKTTTKAAMNNAPSHPDGNFIFYATRQMPSTQSFMAANNSFNPYMMLSQMKGM